ncbi:MAG: hypothetical protein ACUZ8E_00680 [Candidatus Anammoxibacter sp.]
MNTVTRKMFQHGKSKAITLPKDFVDHVEGKELVIKYTANEAFITSKSGLDNMESEPLFADFIKAIAIDAMSHPEKLRNPSEAWSSDVIKILEKVPDNDEDE